MKNYEEIYNPYIIPHRDLNLKLENALISNREIKTDLEWLQTSSAKDINTNISQFFKLRKYVEEDLIGIQEKLFIKRADLNNTQEKIMSRFNPKYYFSKDQKKLRTIRIDLIRSINTLETMRALSHKTIGSQNVSINNLHSDLNRYKSLDLQTLKTESEKNDQYIESLTKEVDSISIKKNKAETKLKPLTDELSRIDLEIEKTNSIIGKAETYDKGLSNAHDKAGRAIIHQECERILGDGKPRRIITLNRELLKKHKRDLEKLLQRVEKASAKATREINAVIIDGNNMAYENNNFIGLKALIPTTAILKEDYEVKVIFDSEIRSMLISSSDSISEQFDDAVKVHIVASKQKADETILELASVDSNTYVISNDRFSDYFDKGAVKTKRILRHEIVGNLILIHDLDFKITY